MSSDTGMIVFLVVLAAFLGGLVASIYQEFYPDWTPDVWLRNRKATRKARKDNLVRLERIADQVLDAREEQAQIDKAVAEAVLRYRIDTAVSLAINAAYQADYQARKAKEDTTNCACVKCDWHKVRS